MGMEEVIIFLRHIGRVLISSRSWSVRIIIRILLIMTIMIRKKYWKGYDAFAQTEEAVHYMEEHANGEKPFVLFLSWGPPHSPYEVVPEEF